MGAPSMSRKERPARLKINPRFSFVQEPVLVQCPSRCRSRLYSAQGLVSGLGAAPQKSHEACPSEEFDRLYSLEAHHDGLFVAYIIPPGAVERALAGFVCRSVGGRSPRGMPARVRMAAFARKVAVQFNVLRRSGLFGRVCVNQGGLPRARNATVRRDSQNEVRVSRFRRALVTHA